MRELRCFPEADCNAINSWSGSTGQDNCRSFWTLRARIEGPVDEHSGFLCDVKMLDGLLRRSVIPNLRSSLAGDTWTLPALGRALANAIADMDDTEIRPASVSSLELGVSPFLRLTVCRGEPQMLDITRSFEFAAAHRLYRPEWTDQKNLEVFGKCSNPTGHGHNYVLEVTVGAPAEDHASSSSNPRNVERVVNERVIELFDHRNLNVDCEEFHSLNPTVENIARVIWSRLDGAFEREVLRAVRVWETPKTYAEYTGP